jgi:hypothetical protein
MQRIAGMTTEEYARHLRMSDEEARQAIQRICGSAADSPEVDAEIERLKRSVKRPQAFKATLKFADDRAQDCCDAGHDPAEGARAHVEQIAAELGYDANENALPACQVAVGHLPCLN